MKIVIDTPMYFCLVILALGIHWVNAAESTHELQSPYAPLFVFESVDVRDAYFGRLKRLDEDTHDLLLRISQLQATIREMTHAYEEAGMPIHLQFAELDFFEHLHQREVMLAELRKIAGELSSRMYIPSRIRVEPSNAESKESMVDHDRAAPVSFDSE